MFDALELNIAIELWGVAFCVVGIVCCFLFTNVGERWRNLILAGFAVELVAAGGDAIAGMFRGQAGSLAWMATHLGNLATFMGGFLLVAVLTVYVCVRIEDAEAGSYRAWYRSVLVASVVMCVLAALGLFYTIDDSNVYHRSDWHWVSLLFAVAANLVNAVLILKSRHSLGNRATACLAFYTLAPVLAAAVQAFVYGLNFVIVAGVAGLVIVFLEMQAYTAQALIAQSNELAQLRADAAESRIAVMVSQIQPHFLFNSLDTIYGLCDEDPELAKAAIASFSRYLRTNLDSLNRTTPVPIETELEHTRTYLELERMSDEDSLHYECDVQATGFSVPALSVQTLAENAVKHGLGGKEGGGTVIIRTREQRNEYTVAIIDDGIGFDVSAPPRGNSGVGLANTRARLSAMCAGTLDVISNPGEGATVVMHIPKKQEG